MLKTIEKCRVALNGVCPYFTMFPLEFPYRILKRAAKCGDVVADPFCGRGTTLYASRLLGLPCVGIDSNPVAVAISQAKLSKTTPKMIVSAAKRILRDLENPVDVPEGDFWEWAFDQEVLQTICRLREGLLKNCDSDVRKALRGIILGALHGPIHKRKRSYFSNQCTRTYAPKPKYAVRFWKTHGYRPSKVEVLNIIEQRAERYYGENEVVSMFIVRQGDSRKKNAFRNMKKLGKVKWVITSPPYYGMNTYIPDQWLRFWFLGGAPIVTYKVDGQLSHYRWKLFANQLRQVWENVSMICDKGAKLIIRFGAINDRQIDPVQLIKESLRGTQWRCITRKGADSAERGKRQSLHFNIKNSNALQEYDFWATL